MLKLRIALLLVLLALVAGFAGAQQAEDLIDDPSSMFVRTIFLDTVYTHKLGFKVTYTADDYTRQALYLPQGWFTQAGSQGQLVSTYSDAAPYMDVFYDNGEFSHVRVYVPANRDHIAWETLEEEGVEENFNVETVTLD